PGALGTGGGAGGFNQYQGAIIGIQPAVAASTTFDLQLNKRLTVSPNPIDFGSDVTVSFNITNRGTAGFQGDYAVGLFTDAGEFVSFIGEAKTGFTLSAGNRYTSDLTFTQSSLFLSEGNYIIAAYYRETQKEWQLMGKATFENAVSVPVAGVDDVLKMYATPLQTSTSPVYQGTPFSVSCNIANFGTNAFEGALSMDVYSTDGEFVANIETKENQSLTTNQTYTSALVFKTAGLAIPVGTYLLVPTYKRKANSEYYVLAAYKDAKGSYPNLIQLVVAAPVLVADRFEDNDKEPQATTLPVSFANNVATVTTESANLHLGSDIDYYKLNLPGGYSYEVTARVHDSDNTGNGKTYTTDVIFSYKSGNRAYSDVYDVSVNDANSKIIPTAGSALIFKVAPYFVGDDGTYRLDIQITRSSVVLGVDDNPVNEQVTVYPNPTTGPVTVQTPPSADFKTITVLNGMGQRVLEVNGPRTGGKTPVDLSGQPAGVYFLQLTGSGQPVTRKISVIK
ncbi:MAG: T9SS type A sorting domain-containing protein, partial [Bacteroidetes bacterium]|nr:T9SS type A sorting domain-containing protein [Fibrella sp.]